MRWSTISVVGREVSRAVFTIVIARLVGPEDFGIVAQAMVYIAIVGLLLDQGFSIALIQRKQIEPDMPGVVVTVNLAVGASLTMVTIAVAPLWASFMHTPELLLVLMVLSPCLLVRSVGMTARAMLMREMNFRAIGIADMGSAVLGGALGVLAAFAGAGYWSVVLQILVTDVVYQAILAAYGRWRPNLRFRLLREIAGFSLRVFAAGILVIAVSRNIDNLLVGRFQGPQALAFYGLAYRLLLLPIQIAIASVGAVLFPAFTQIAHDRAALAAEMARATRALAALSLPVMALVAAAAPQLIAVFFGPEWLPAIPIVQVLAIAGALQAIYHTTTMPLVVGLGHAKLNLRYAWLMTVITTVGVVAGLPFGPFGVAVGYMAATGLLVPVEWLIRRRLLGMTFRGQIALLAPAAHVAIWVAAVYLLIAAAIPGHELVVLPLGILAASCTGAAVLRVAHRSLLAELLHMAKRIVGRGSPRQDTPSEPAQRGQRDAQPNAPYVPRHRVHKRPADQC
jgi:PST family polysaccharide transporter